MANGDPCWRCHCMPCICGPAPSIPWGWNWQNYYPGPNLMYFPIVCPKCNGYGMRYDSSTEKTVECECGALAIHRKYERTAEGK